jgi:hypothetical protein
MKKKLLILKIDILLLLLRLKIIIKSFFLILKPKGY